MKHAGTLQLEQMRPRARAAVEALELHYRAEFAQALMAKELPPAMKHPEGAPKLPKGSKRVVERLMEMTKEANRAQRKALLKHTFNAPIAGRKLTAREQIQLKTWAKSDSKIPMVERTGIIKRLGKILSPGKGFDPKNPKDVLGWQDGIIRDLIPGLTPLDGRPDDAMPGTPEPDEDGPPEDVLYPGAPVTPELHFKVQRVTCVQDTSEWGSDEISYSGVAVDGSGVPTNNPPLDNAELMGRVNAGQFRSGDVRDMSGRDPLHTFDLTGVTTPHLFFAIFSMAEIDNTGGFPEYLNRLLVDLNAEMRGFWANVFAWTASTTALYAGVGALMPPFLLLMTVLGFIYGLTAGLVMAFALDDVFPPSIQFLELVDDAINLPPFNGNLISQELSLTTGDFGGAYGVDYVWEIVSNGGGSTGDQDSDQLT